MKKFNINYEDLYDLYITQGLSTLSIGKLYDVHHTSVLDKLNKFSIKTRNISEGKKLSKLNRGSSSKLFRHGLSDNGYRVFRQNGKKTKEHRIVAERILRRSLDKNEVVHHVNGIKTDNRVENLWIFPSQKDHAKYHWNGTIHKDTIILKNVD
jgi:hypothetical protein